MPRRVAGRRPSCHSGPPGPRTGRCPPDARSPARRCTRPGRRSSLVCAIASISERGPTVEAPGRAAHRVRPACRSPAEMSRWAVSTSPSVNSSSAVARRQPARDALELGVGDQAEHRPVGVEHRPAGPTRRAATRPAGGPPCAARSHRWPGRGAGGSRWRTPHPSSGPAGTRWPPGGIVARERGDDAVEGTGEEAATREPASTPLPETSTTTSSRTVVAGAPAPR